MKEQEQNIFGSEDFDFSSNFGGFDIDEGLNMEFFDFDPADTADTENRYIKPKLVPMRDDQICYARAEELAREIKLERGGRYDCLVSGSFIFGDFIEAFVHTKTLHMTTAGRPQDSHPRLGQPAHQRQRGAVHD